MAPAGGAKRRQQQDFAAAGKVFAMLVRPSAQLRRILLTCALFLALSECASGHSSVLPITVVVGTDPDLGCITSIDGQQMNLEKLAASLKMRRRDQEVHLISASPKVPYRCIGAAIYTLQVQHVRFKAGFISELPIGKGDKL